MVTPIELPPKLSVPVKPLPLVKVLLPLGVVRVVLTVIVPLLVTDAPLAIATLGITVAVEPLIIAGPEPVKVCVPVLAVQVVALLVRLPANDGVIAACSFQTPLTVTSPVKVLPGLVAEEKMSEPVAATFVVPVTEKVNPARVKVVPAPTLRLPPMVSPTTVVTETVPLLVKLPLIVVTPTGNVGVPLPLNVKW